MTFLSSTPPPEPLPPSSTRQNGHLSPSKRKEDFVRRFWRLSPSHHPHGPGTYPHLQTLVHRARTPLTRAGPTETGVVPATPPYQSRPSCAEVSQDKILRLPPLCVQNLLRRACPSSPQDRQDAPAASGSHLWWRVRFALCPVFIPGRAPGASFSLPSEPKGVGRSGLGRPRRGRAGPGRRRSRGAGVGPKEERAAQADRDAEEAAADRGGPDCSGRAGGYSTPP